MKLYVKPETPELIYIVISKVHEETKYINVEGATQDEMLVFIKEIVSEHKISPFIIGQRTRVDVRLRKGDERIGVSKSISFRGLSTIETYNLIINKITNYGK